MNRLQHPNEQEDGLGHLFAARVGRLELRSQVSVLFLLKNFIYFNWRLITLQYYGGFCHTLT